MTVIHVLPKRFEDFLRHLDCNSPWKIHFFCATWTTIHRGVCVAVVWGRFWGGGGWRDTSAGIHGGFFPRA